MNRRTIFPSGSTVLLPTEPPVWQVGVKSEEVKTIDQKKKRRIREKGEGEWLRREGKNWP